MGGFCRGIGGGRDRDGSADQESVESSARGLGELRLWCWASERVMEEVPG